MTQAVSLSFFRYDRLTDRLWALAMMAAARPAMARLEHVGFWKLLGSGVGEGFTPTALPRVIAILCTWPDEATAREQVERARIFGRYRRRASETWSVFLSPESAIGCWSGRTPFEAGGRKPGAALAALTRATLRPRRLARFWRRVPAISTVIGRNEDVVFKIGVGEVPLLQQVTFSIWPDRAAMARFARTGHHAEAIERVRSEGWFREELYARFSILSDQGSWNGRSPLAGLELQ